MYCQNLEYGRVTTEKHLPPLEGSSKPHPLALVIKNARGWVDCAECNKPVIVWSNKKCTNMQLELWKESIVITHGRTIPENPGNFYVNHKLTCASKVEKQYYKLGPDRCVHCGILIEDESISNQADELFKKYYNVRPSCKDCGETLFSNGRKKEYLLGKRRRADQIGGAKKKQKVDSVTQQDLEDVARRAGEAAPHGDITDSWMEVMKTWWRKIRRSRN